MNTSKVAAALNTISLAFGELAEALNEQPETPPSGVGSAGRAAPETGSPPATFSDGMPVSEPPVWTDMEFSDEPLPDPRSQPALADESVEFRPPAQTERDVVLGRCPTHDVPWTIRAGGVSKTGKSYSAFWKCAERNDDDTWCQKKPVKDWVRVHDPEKALAAA